MSAPFALWWKRWTIDTTGAPPAYTHRVKLHWPEEVTALELAVRGTGELRTTVTVRNAPHFLSAFFGLPRRPRRSRGWRRHIRRLKAARRGRS